MTRKKDVLSNSEQCEKGLLCSFIRSPEKVGDLCLFRNVTEKWFYDEDRQKIFTCLTQMRKEGKPIETLSVVQYCIDNDHKLKFATPFIDATVMDSSEFIATASNATYYVDQLQKCLAKREFQLALLKTTESLKTATELQDLHDLATGAFKDVLEACSDKEDCGNQDRKAMMDFLEKMEMAARGECETEFFPTGLPSIDNECGGLIRGEVLMIRGRKGTGKSLLGQKIISSNVLSAKKPKAAIFTYEMSHDQYMRRLIADNGNVCLKSMRDSRYNKGELNSFQSTWLRIAESNLRIYDIKRLRGSRSASTLFAAIRKQVKNKGLDIVLIDHLHLIKFKDSATKRSDEHMHDFTAELKAVCGELGIAGILLAQENSDGGTFGGTQVETDVDTSLSLTTVIKEINGIKRIVGTDGAFCDKCRDGDLLGRKIPLIMTGKYARIEENIHPTIK